MMLGIGTPSSRPLPRMLNTSGNSQIGRPSVYTNAMPRHTVINASVTMKGVMLYRVMRAPATAPDNAPAVSPTRTASGNETVIGSCSFSTSVVRMPASARSEPTDKSIPPVRITNVIPAAIIAVMETCKETLRRLSVVRKYGERNEKTRSSTTNAMPIPSSLVSVNGKEPERVGMNDFINSSSSQVSLFSPESPRRVTLRP